MHSKNVSSLLLLTRWCSSQDEGMRIIFAASSVTVLNANMCVNDPFSFVGSTEPFPKCFSGILILFLVRISISPTTEKIMRRFLPRWRSQDVGVDCQIGMHVVVMFPSTMDNLTSDAHFHFLQFVAV